MHRFHYISIILIHDYLHYQQPFKYIKTKTNKRKEVESFHDACKLMDTLKKKLDH